MPNDTNDSTATVPKIIVLDPCEKITDWSEGATGTDNLAITSTHRSGRWALTFDKIAGGTTASIARTIDRVSLNEMSEVALAALRFYASALTDIASVSLDIGESASNYATYTWLDTVLAADWQRLEARIADPTAVAGRGLDTGNIKWVQVRVVFDGAANTLAGLIVDQIVCEIGASEDELAMAADIAACKALLTTIDADTGTIAGDTTSLDGKDFATETTAATLALEAGGNLAAIAGDTPKLDVALSTVATQVTLASVLADTTAILSDTSSIDGKTPALGQALMAASVPVAIASDQSALPVSVVTSGSEVVHVIDNMDSTSGWTIYGDATLGSYPEHVEGSASIYLTKDGGTSTECMMWKAISPAINLDGEDLAALAVQFLFRPSTADLAAGDYVNLVVRIGAAHPNVSEYVVPAANLGLVGSRWSLIRIPLTKLYQTLANGGDTSNITRIYIGFTTPAAGTIVASPTAFDDIKIVRIGTVVGPLHSGASQSVIPASDSPAFPVDIQTLTADVSTETTLAAVAGDTASIDGKTPVLGQAAKAGSVPVTLASDEDTINVDVTANSIGLATQATLAAQSAKLPASLGAKTGAASLSMVPASDAGMATSALQTTGNSTLTAISGKLPSTLGAKTSALSLSVTAASDTVLAKDASVTAMSAKLPASLGAKTAAASFSMVPASDAGMATSALQTTLNAKMPTHTARDTGGSTLSLETTGRPDVDTYANYSRGKSTANITAASPIIAAPGAGKRLAILGISAAADGTTEFTLTEDGAGQEVRWFELPAQGTYKETGTPDAPLFVLATNTGLDCVTTGANNKALYIATIVVDA